MKRSTPRFSSQSWDALATDVDPASNAFDLPDIKTTPDDSDLTITPINHLVEAEEDAIDRLLANSGFERSATDEPPESNKRLLNDPILDAEQAAFRVEPIPDEPDSDATPVDDAFKVETFLREYLTKSASEQPSSIVTDTELADFIPIDRIKPQAIPETNESTKTTAPFVDEPAGVIDTAQTSGSEQLATPQPSESSEEMSSSKPTVNVADASIRRLIAERHQRNLKRYHANQLKLSMPVTEPLAENIQKEITVIEKQLFRMQKQLTNTTQLSYAVLAFSVLILIANAVLFIKFSTIKIDINKLTEWVVMLKEDFENPLAEKQPEP